MKRTTTAAMGLVVLAFLALPALAQLTTPYDPAAYDGVCQSTALTAISYPGTPYRSNSVTYSFTCTGTFYGRITAKVLLEDPSQLVCTSSGCAAAVVAYRVKEWPILGTRCGTSFDTSECFTYVKQAMPVNTSLSVVVQSTSATFTGRGIIEWATGPCTTIFGVANCPTASSSMVKSARTLTPTTN